LAFFSFTPSMTLSRTFRLIQLRLLRQVADMRPFGGPGLAGEILVEPAMIRISVDLPAPFTPTTPIFTPGRKLSRMFSKHFLPPG
jgi:hypothetical protein